VVVPERIQEGKELQFVGCEIPALELLSHAVRLANIFFNSPAGDDALHKWYMVITDLHFEFLANGLSSLNRLPPDFGTPEFGKKIMPKVLAWVKKNPIEIRVQNLKLDTQVTTRNKNKRKDSTGLSCGCIASRSRRPYI
jgi:hypothetical protein